MSDTRCVLADIGLALQNNGHMTICNQSQQLLCDDNGEYLRLDKHTVEQAWNSPTRKQIKIDLDSGIKNNNCRQCFQEEAAGVTSGRMLFNERFREITPKEDQPLAFFLKPGNTCNLACRHCSPWVSSRWYRDHYEALVDDPDKNFNQWLIQFKAQQDSYDENNPFWKTFTRWGHDAVWFDLYGAEPTLIKSLTNALSEVAKSPYARQKSIHINTNGTNVDRKFLELLTNFQHVDFEISADGIGPQFEYMRHPASWNQFLDNLQIFEEFRSRYSDVIDIQITCTLSLYNIWNAADIKNFFERELGIIVGFNFVHHPDYMDLRNVPEEKKSLVRDHLIKAGINKPVFFNYNGVIGFLMSESDGLDRQANIKRFFEVTDRVDSYRGQSFQKVFPEMYEILRS